MAQIIYRSLIAILLGLSYGCSSTENDSSKNSAIQEETTIVKVPAERENTDSIKHDVEILSIEVDSLLKDI